MEVVDFYPSAFVDIPKQDNPAINCTEACMLLVGNTEDQGGVRVLHIIPHDVESVTVIASFWDHKKALRYAENYARIEGIEGHDTGR